MYDYSFKISEAAKRTNRKRIRKNLIIVGTIASAVLCLFFWGSYGAYIETELLAQYGKEVLSKEDKLMVHSLPE